MMNNPPMLPGLSAIQDILDDVIVTRVNDVLFFNGDDSPYAAIVKIEPTLKTIPFSKQMVLTTFLWNMIISRNLARLPVTFVYSFFRKDDFFEMCVINDETGDIAFSFEGTDLIDQSNMSDEFDINGLQCYLKDVNIMSQYDTLIFRDYHQF